MKNKHLVLLFLITLAAGIALRKAPWRESVFFEADLLKIDSAAIVQLDITLPKKPPLSLVRHDAGWAAEQSERHTLAPVDKMQELLLAISSLRSSGIHKTSRPDTLGLSENHAIELKIQCRDGRKEVIRMGEDHTYGTYVQLPRHEGIYLCKPGLRALFLLSLDDFRRWKPIDFSTFQLREIVWTSAGEDSIRFKKEETTGRWTNNLNETTWSGDSVQLWLNRLENFRPTVFADWFDETRRADYPTDEWQFAGPAPERSFQIWLYRVSDQQHRRGKREAWVIQHSMQAGAYFECSDTALFRRACPFF
jgi:hypothetical protein